MDGKAKGLDAAWAASAMKGRISWLGRRLVSQGAVEPEWREDAEGALLEAVLDAASRYDASAAESKGAKAASPLHWLHVAADNRARQIMLRGWYRKRRAKFTSLDAGAEDEGGGGEGREGGGGREIAASGEDAPGALAARLDCAALLAALSPAERRLLELRLAGYSCDEAARAFGVTRSQLRSGLMRSLARKAVACGFTPRDGRH